MHCLQAHDLPPPGLQRGRPRSQGRETVPGVLWVHCTHSQGTGNPLLNFRAWPPVYKLLRKCPINFKYAHSLRISPRKSLWAFTSLAQNIYSLVQGHKLPVFPISCHLWKIRCEVPPPYLRCSSSYKNKSRCQCLKLLAQNYNYYINVDDCKTMPQLSKWKHQTPNLLEEIKLLMC